MARPRPLKLLLGVLVRPEPVPLPGRYPRNWARLRRAALERDDYRCRNCGRRRTDLMVHHIVPLRRGGRNDLSNLATLCRRCHTLVEPHVAHLPHPRRPTMTGRIRRRLGR